VLRIFGYKREEDGSQRKLNNDDLHSPYSSPNVVMVIKSRRKWAGHVARMGEERVYRALVGRSEGKRPLGRPRRRWEDNIKLDLRDRWDKLNSPDSEQCPVAGICEHGNEPPGSIKKVEYFSIS
jgi:hypothetical protein